MDAPPWALDLRGLVFGEVLGEHTRRRLGLQPEEPDEYDEPNDACSGWSSPDGTVRVVTCDGLIALVSPSDTAALDGVDLIGASREAVVGLLGQPRIRDEITGAVSFREGPWELEIGFDLIDVDCVAWVRLSNDDLLDGP